MIAGSSARVWDVATKKYVSPELVTPGRAFQVVFNRQADRFATLAVGGYVAVYEVGTLKTTPLCEIIYKPSTAPGSSKTTPFRVDFVDEDRSILLFKLDKEIVAWHDATTGAEIRRLQSGLFSIKSVFLSTDGRTIAARGLGGVQFWDGKTGEPRGRFGDASVEAASFTVAGTGLIMSTGHYLAAPFRFPDGERGDWVIRHQDLANAIMVSRDDSLFALAQLDGLVRVWRLPETTPGNWVPMAASSAVRLAMSPDGSLVMPIAKHHTGGPSFTQVHDLISHRVGPDLHLPGILFGGAISPDGRQVVTLSSPAAAADQVGRPSRSARGWVNFWDWRSGVSRIEPILTPSTPVDAAYRPDGQRVVVLCAQGECLWIDPRTGKILSMNKPENVHFTGGPANEYLRFSPDGKLLVEWGMGTPILMNAMTGLEHSPALPPRPKGAIMDVLDAHFSADSRYLVTSCFDKTAKVWDLATGKLAVPPIAHPDWVFQSVFSSDGSMLLTGGRDGTARVWNWRTQRLLGQTLTQKGEVQDVGFLNHDRWVVTKSSHDEMTKSTDNAVQIWDWRSGKPLTPPRLVPGPWGSQFRLAPDGARAAMGGISNRTMQVLELARWTDADDPRFPAEQLQEIAELSSGLRIVGGSSVVALTTAEWIERWRKYRAATRVQPLAPGRK